MPATGAIFVAPDGDDSADGSVGAPLNLSSSRATAPPKTRPCTPSFCAKAPTTSKTLSTSPRSTLASPFRHTTVSAPWSAAARRARPRGRSRPKARATYVANAKGQVEEVPGLQMDGKRATARHPNLPGGLEASCGYGCMIPSNQGEWTPPNFDKFGPVTYYTDNQTKTDRPDTPSNWFQHYSVGINGLCSVYDPPVSYWCSEHTAGGGAFAFRTPNGVTPKKGALPHSPYKDVSEAQLFVWRPARWANWMFEVGQYDSASNNSLSAMVAFRAHVARTAAATGSLRTSWRSSTIRCVRTKSPVHGLAAHADTRNSQQASAFPQTACSVQCYDAAARSCRAACRESFLRQEDIEPLSRSQRHRPARGRHLCRAAEAGSRQRLARSGTQ